MEFILTIAIGIIIGRFIFAPNTKNAKKINTFWSGVRDAWKQAQEQDTKEEKKEEEVIKDD